MLVPTAMRLSLAVYLVLLIVIFAFSDCAAAQQSNTYRIGFLTPASSASMEARVERFRQGLRELSDGKEQRLSDLAVELVRLKVDVLVSHGVLATQAAKRASVTIPIVCFACGDAVSVGLVASLARPGGTITAFCASAT
jgi:putative tryptophan/tyrosine transport system substrate-binding protein